MGCTHDHLANPSPSTHSGLQASNTVVAPIRYRSQDTFVQSSLDWDTPSHGQRGRTKLMKAMETTSVVPALTHCDPSGIRVAFDDVLKCEGLIIMVNGSELPVSTQQIWMPRLYNFR